MTRIAVIGCGAIADTFHLPALLASEGEGLELVLVDPSLERAREMSRRHGVKEVASSHREVASSLDGAVIASPHNTHAPIASDLLRAGVPVLVEKPLGTSAAEIRELAGLAAERGVAIAVNQTRRFIPACREVSRLLATGELGALLSIEVAEGDRFGWPSASPAMFGARSGGRGVLLDIGVHTLDLLCWWLGGGITVEACLDDGFGGSEAAFQGRFTRAGVPIEVRLSWLARQENLYRIRGEDAEVEWAVYDLDRVRLKPRGAGRDRVVRVPDAPAAYADLAHAVVGNFLQVIRGEAAPTVSAADVLPAMELIDACYARRERFSMPWQGFQAEVTDVP